MIVRSWGKKGPSAPGPTIPRRIAPTQAFLRFLVPAVLTFAGTSTPFAQEDTVSGAEMVSIVIERTTTREVSEPTALRFDAFGQHVDLFLEKNRGLVAPQAEALLVGVSGASPLPLADTWKGQGTDGSEARLTLDGDQARGYVRTPVGVLLIEPTTTGASPAILHSVRRAEDPAPGDAPVDCGTSDELQEPVSPPAAALRREADSPLRVLDVSAVGDAAFHRRYGDSSVLRMLSLFNQVDGLYRTELGIALRIVQIVVYESDAAQPFPPVLDAATRLTALSEARRTDPVLSLAGEAVLHLMTGDGMDGHQGIAWPSSVCDPVYSTSISLIDSKSDHFATLLIAHEIGHTLGAYHDGPDGYGCVATPRNFIMWPVIDPASTESFSLCSRERIAQRTSVASCMERTVPDSCGDGLLDPEEECDPGTAPDSPCCHSDCTWAPAGMPCSGSGSACNESSCAAGTCVIGQDPRQLETVEATMRLTVNGMVDRAKVRVTAPMFTSGGDPSQDGFAVATTIADTVAWQDYVPAHRWIRKSDTRFAYKNPEAEAGQLRSALLEFDPSSSRAVFRLAFSSPMVSLSPDPPTVSVLSGNAESGQCGTGEPLQCNRTGGKFRCE